MNSTSTVLVHTYCIKYIYNIFFTVIADSQPMLTIVKQYRHQFFQLSPNEKIEFENCFGMYAFTDDNILILCHENTYGFNLNEDTIGRAKETHLYKYKLKMVFDESTETLLFLAIKNLKDYFLESVQKKQWQ